MRIAVIDEGVIPEFKDELNIVEDLMINSDHLVINRSDYVRVMTDHGLNVCKIVKMYAKEAEIISIRIFSSLEMKTNIEALVSAFKYCLDNKIPIIHLSGGTVNLIDDYLLRGIIKEIIKNNQIIVAAHSNKKGLSFPALYPCVFSVRCEELFGAYNGSKNRWGYSFLMPSRHKININENLNYVTQIANSYAAPVLTANIYNIINSNQYDKDISILRDLGITHHIFLCELPSFLDDVTIINLSNEVVLEEVVQFKIKSIYYDTTFKENSGDFIFIPHKNTKTNIRKLKEFINALSVNDKRTRVFYLGIKDSYIESIMSCHPFEFWVLPDNEVYPISASNANLNDCAIIYFQGKKEVIFYIMAQLRDAFLKNGFNCFAFSDYLEATLCDIYYFNDLASSIRRQQLEHVFEPDVELVYAKDEFYRQTENSMLIEVAKVSNKIKLLISTGNIKEEVYMHDSRDIKDLFTKIINMDKN